MPTSKDNFRVSSRVLRAERSCRLWPRIGPKIGGTSQLGDAISVLGEQLFARSKVRRGSRYTRSESRRVVRFDKMNQRMHHHVLDKPGGEQDCAPVEIQTAGLAA